DREPAGDDQTFGWLTASKNMHGHRAEEHRHRGEYKRSDKACGREPRREKPHDGRLAGVVRFSVFGSKNFRSRSATANVWSEPSVNPEACVDGMRETALRSWNGPPSIVP